MANLPCFDATTSLKGLANQRRKRGVANGPFRLGLENAAATATPVRPAAADRQVTTEARVYFNNVRLVTPSVMLCFPYFNKLNTAW